MSEINIPYIPNPGYFHELVEGLREHEGLIAQHSPELYAKGYPKAFDLGYLAVYYSGGAAWSKDSATGGMSVATRVPVAMNYLHDAVPRLWGENGYSHASSAPNGQPPKSKILAFIQPTTHNDIVPPHHFGNEGDGKERIITSARLSGFDIATQGLIRKIFGEKENPEYIRQ